jgi:hypothetical protein
MALNVVNRNCDSSKKVPELSIGPQRRVAKSVTLSNRSVKKGKTIINLQPVQRLVLVKTDKGLIGGVIAIGGFGRLCFMCSSSRKSSLLS